MEISIHHVIEMFVCIIWWLASHFYQLMQFYGLRAETGMIQNLLFHFFLDFILGIWACLVMMLMIVLPIGKNSKQL